MYQTNQILTAVLQKGGSGALSAFVIYLSLSGIALRALLYLTDRR